MLTLRNVRSIAITGALVALAARAVPLAEQSTPRSAPEPLHVNGLERPVEVLRDRWGINHIYAKNEHDLFFAQGYAAARDRLFQFEIWRRQATGTVGRDPRAQGAEARHRHAAAHVPRRPEDRAELVPPARRGHRHGVRRRHQRLHRRGARSARPTCRSSSRCSASQPEHWTPAVVISRHNGLLGNLGAGS